MTAINVKVFVESHAAHTTQFYSGLYMLQEQGLVQVHLASGDYSSDAFVRIEINGTPVFIDLADHSHINEARHKQCRFYFKRMLLKSDVVKYPNLHPYGLNYPVYYQADRTFRRSFYSKNRKHIINSFIRSSPFLASLFKVDLGHHTARVHHFESPPLLHQKPTAIFSARLWLPDKGRSGEKQQQRKSMNDQRIAIVREARKRLGENFTGGIDIDNYSRQVANDTLINNPAFSQKKSYLQLLKRCSIGIANAGLENSIGFKMAEYVSMSKAIVTSPIDEYVLPGSFKDEQNYLSFDNSAKDCISRCEELLQNEHLRNQMMQNNHLYYQQYLRPDRLVMNIIKTVTGG
jgi:hypothetical protein